MLPQMQRFFPANGTTPVKHCTHFVCAGSILTCRLIFWHEKLIFYSMRLKNMRNWDLFLRVLYNSQFWNTHSYLNTKFT
jgi:hypothetical protein